MLQQKIKVDELKLSDIVHDIEHGHLRIPRFQREFVWERSKVVKLLDSIYREYPIGSFFIWEADKKYNLFYRNIAELDLPAPDSYSTIRYILDGQQRATSLFAAIKGLTIGGVDYSHIHFDFDREEFVIRTHDRFDSASLKDILGDNKFAVYNKLSDERKRAFDKCYSIFTGYPLSVIVVREKELEEASDIFERINQGGKRLSIFDLVVAGTWGEDFDLKHEYQILSDDLEHKGFGAIPPEVVTHASALIIRGYCRNSYQLQLTKEELKEKWEEIANAIRLAVDYLANNLGVRIYDFVPYPSIIPLLAYLYFKVPGRSLTKAMAETVHEWFWKAALSDRYGSSRETRMEEDRRMIFDALLDGKDVKIGYNVVLDTEKIMRSKITTKSAIRNAFFCMLALRQPKHFKTNALISLDRTMCADFNNPEKHHIFPRYILRKAKLDGEYLLANFCFIPAELNKEILHKLPSEYFAEYKRENPEFTDALSSHLIAYDDAIKTNDFRTFIKARSQMIFEEFERLIGSKILKVAGQNANRAVDETESLIRTLITETLQKNVGNEYWKSAIPSDIQEKVSVKIEEFLRKHPGQTKENISVPERLTYCDIMDYSNIILKNWEYFESFFRSKPDTEKRFVAFKDFRNAVKHNREVDPVLRRDGEASLEWFSQALKPVKRHVEDDSDGEIKVRSVTPTESDEEIVKRVKSDFVRKAVLSIRNWIDEEYKNGELTVKKGSAGSYHSIMRGSKLVLFYYFANNWVYGELQYTSKEEMELLKRELSDPTSVVDRHGRYGQVRFHLITNHDLDVVKGIFRNRMSGVVKAEDTSQFINTYLLVWNPKRWTWTNLEEKKAEILRDGYSMQQWSCGKSKRIRKGDRVFFIRLGEEPRGIFASGIVERGSYESDHWDPLAVGKAWFVDVKLDKLRNPETDAIVPRSLLDREDFQPMHYDSQRSGIQIPEDVARNIDQEFGKIL